MGLQIYPWRVMALNNGERITAARMDAGLTSKQLAELMGVDKTTVSNWESGTRQMSLERLVQLAKALNVSVTYLLGLDERADIAEPIAPVALPMFHRTPVWTKSRGWALVNAAEQTLVYADKTAISFDQIQEPIYAIPPVNALSLRGLGGPLSFEEVLLSEQIWVEPISTDADLANQLRGWYRPHSQRLVENEFGNRFYMDTYGAKWLAFEGCPSCVHYKKGLE